MGKTFRIPVHGDLDAKLRVAQQKAAARGVTMSGTTQSGRFSGLISGTYKISGGVATVYIATKPPDFLASWDYIEQQLREFLQG